MDSASDGIATQSALHDALVDDRSPKYADLAFRRHQDSYTTSWVRTWVDL
jgi:hypothetical protein